MHVLTYGSESRKPSQEYVMHVLRYGIAYFRHNFRHCEIFSKKNFWATPARADNYYGADKKYACGYFITPADIVLT